MDDQALSNWFQESMMVLYGRKPWKSSGFAGAADIWAGSLKKRDLFTPEILKEAIAHCVDHVPTIPSLPQFVEICRAGKSRIESRKPKPKEPAPEPMDPKRQRLFFELVRTTFNKDSTKIAELEKQLGIEKRQQPMEKAKERNQTL